MKQENLALEQLVEQIAQESLNFSNVKDLLTTKFTALVDGIKNLFSKSDIKDEIKQSVLEKKVSSENQVKTLSKVEKLNWAELDHLTIQVPEGFDGDILAYSRELEQACDYILRVQDEIIEPFYVYVSSIISNKNVRLNTKDLRFEYSKNTKDRELITKSLSKYFRRGTNTRQKLINVIRKASDLPELFRVKNAICVHIETYDIAKVKIQVEKLAQMLDHVTILAQDGELEGMTTEVLNSLATGTHEVARQIEIISFVIFSSVVLRTTVEDIETKLGDKLKI